jgi:competence protein ComEC
VSETLRRHPRHVVLAALVAGLLGARLEPAVVLLLALLAAALAGCPPAAVLAPAALVAGALLAQGRLAPGPIPLPAGAVEARVVLLEHPRPVRYGATALARVQGGERVMLRIGSSVAWPASPTGEIIRVRGRLRPLGPFERHYERRGALAAISLDLAAATGSRRGGAWGFVDAVRTRAEAALAVALPAPQSALLRGMALGQDEALDERTRDEFRASGLAHILAASGQNVALLLAAALPLLAWAGLGLRGRLLGALALIALYVPLAGAGPSIQRAGVMGAATTVAGLAGRPASRWYAFLLAAAVTLLVNPRAAEDPGWQLSFAAVAAIALLAAPLRARLRERGAPAALAEALAMTLAATLGTAPLLALHFEQVSLVSVPANLLAAPAIAPVMWLGLAAAALGQLSPALAAPLNLLNAPLLGYVGWIAHATAGLPWASVEIP